MNSKRLNKIRLTTTNTATWNATENTMWKATWNATDNAMIDVTLNETGIAIENATQEFLYELV